MVARRVVARLVSLAHGEAALLREARAAVDEMRVARSRDVARGALPGLTNAEVDETLRELDRHNRQRRRR